MNTSCKRSIPPQAALVMQAIAKACKEVNGECAREDIIKSFIQEDLHTRQSVKRIVNYYLPLLKACELINYESMRGSTFSILL
jgi:hypothetical protein